MGIPKKSKKKMIQRQAKKPIEELKSNIKNIFSLLKRRQERKERRKRTTKTDGPTREQIERQYW